MKIPASLEASTSPGTESARPFTLALHPLKLVEQVALQLLRHAQLVLEVLCLPTALSNDITRFKNDFKNVEAENQVTSSKT